MEDRESIRTWIVMAGVPHEPGSILGVYPEDRATALEHFVTAALRGGAKFADFSEDADGSARVSTRDAWFSLDVFGPGRVGTGEWE